MNDFPQKINNSYESASSSSESIASSNEQSLEKSLQFGTDGHKLTSLMMTSETDLYNLSTEEGIFPNVPDYQSIEVPSYQPDYDYINEYNNTPLVYSWLPIVPGFSEDGFDNLHNFQYLADKYTNPQTLDVFDSSEKSKPVPNQNIKYHDYLAINNPNLKLLNNYTGTEFQNLDNSCNAVPDVLNTTGTEEEIGDPDLSFTGKITELKAHEKTLESAKKSEKLVEQAEEDRLHNESFELLKKEDSSKMLYINEKSPDLFDSNGEVLSDEPHEEADIISKAVKLSEDCDTSILKKLKNSLTGICPPPSVTKFQMSMSEILATYKKKMNENPAAKSTLKTSSFFIPSHLTEEIRNMEWPSLLSAKCLDVSYNKSTVSEDIEMLSLRYVDRYIGEETTSSFNHKLGPSSAKKRVEKLKLLAQSPGRRLSHLANRRKIFSSANLKSSSLASQTSTSGRILIDKSKLYSKALRVKSPLKRTSAKKKTPGKRKTPRSAKRQPELQAETSRASTKRALFTNSSEKSAKPQVASKDNLACGKLPRRSLFSPDANQKRKRSDSPDHDAENREGKLRRILSPTKLPKSQSFSMAPSSSSSSTISNVNKRLLFRTQSEIVPQAIEGNVGLGYRQAMTDVVKKKILWSVSKALNEKKISTDHEKFKEYASVLGKLMKRILMEFHNPAEKSMSEQLMRFANYMVFYVIQGRSVEDIYTTTKATLQSKNTKKVSGYIAAQDYERNKSNLVRRSSSLLFMSQSCNSLNLSQRSENSCDGNSSKLSESNSSLNLTSSKNNEKIVLREKFNNQSSDKSDRNLVGSDSNLTRAKSNSSSNLMKAKRQISF